MKKKLFLLTSWIIIVLTLTSCTERRELDDLGFVVAMGLDIEDEKITMTLEIINPTSSKLTSGMPAQRSSIFIQGTGKTVFEAARNVTLNFDRRAYLSHNSVIVLSEELAKRGIGDVVDFLSRDNEQRETAYLIVAKNAKAYEVMGINAGLSNSFSGYLTNLIENFERNEKTRSITIFEFFKYYYDLSTGPILAVVEKVEKKEISKETNKQVPQESKEDSMDKYALDLSGGAAFARDKMLGYFSGDEMIGFNFIVDEYEKGLIVFETPKKLSEEISNIGRVSKYTVVEALKSETKKEVEIIDGKIHLTLKVNIKGALEEATSGVDIGNIEVIELIEKTCSEKVKELIENTMDKAQKEFQYDSFSIGALVHRKYPDEWKEISTDWHNVFSKISYTVDVKTEILRTGLTDSPSNIRKR